MLKTIILPLLNKQNIKGSSGVLTFEFNNTKILLSTKDIIGGVLQEWFGFWMTNNNIYWEPGPHSQLWPDFILGDKKHLEFKSFDGTANPNFDLANFDSYTRSLLSYPERIDTEHLIFEYTLLYNGSVKINDFYVKKIWEMTGPSKSNILTLQVKQGLPQNIRPKNFCSHSGNIEFFKTRKDFVMALDAALCKFHPCKYANWFDLVAAEYFKKTNQYL